MIRLFSVNGAQLEKSEFSDVLLKSAAWIDLISPSETEEKQIEHFFKAEIPSKEEQTEIELSNRFYEENGVLYMTVNILVKAAASGEPEKHPATLILAKGKLITIRHVEPESFKIFESRLNKCNLGDFAGEYLLGELLEAFINRNADIVETVDDRVDAISTKIFRADSKAASRKGEKHFQILLRDLGQCGDLISKTQESLISILRLIAFLVPQMEKKTYEKLKDRLDSINRDASALRDHNSFMIDKITFLQDATLGLINIQQNDIMKIFSIAAVCFVPSTIITGFFGMNFKNMPEYDIFYGQYLAFALMALSLIISFIFFWRKGWL